jgi:hypothetical protein
MARLGTKGEVFFADRGRVKMPAKVALGTEAQSAKAAHATPPAICGLLSPKRCAQAWRVRAR